MFDYRGYGQSEEKEITEAGLYHDARAAWDYLTKTKKIPAKKITIFGRSMGSSVAIQLATEKDCNGIIIEGSFTCVKDMVRSMVPILPAEKLFNSKFQNIEKIKKIKLPKLFLHAEKDEICPIKLAKKLFEAAPEPKTWVTLHHANHNNTYLVNTEIYLEFFKKFCSNHSF